MLKKVTRQLLHFSSIEKALREAIQLSLKPSRLQIENQSDRHSRGTDTHFNMLIVSEKFRDLSKVQQHQLVYSSVGDLMKQVHALTMTCHSQDPENPKAWSLGCFHSKSK